MKFKGLIFCLINFLLWAQLCPVIILVHGTFAYDTAWCKPGGDFYEELTKAAQKIDQKVVPFVWSGKLNDHARVGAAKSLVKLIQSYPESERIILIGHSHGGNVINFATQLLFDPVAALANVWQPYDIEQMGQCVELVINHLNACKNQKYKKTYIIEEVFLLATPVEEGFFAPCMNVVGKVYNLYSRGDFVQKVGGFYKRKYKKRDRIYNMRLKIAKCGLFGSDDPSHGQMHMPLVAQNILSLKDLPLDCDGTLWLAYGKNLIYEKVQDKGGFLPTHQDQLNTLTTQVVEKV